MVDLGGRRRHKYKHLQTAGLLLVQNLRKELSNSKIGSRLTDLTGDRLSK